VTNPTEDGRNGGAARATAPAQVTLPNDRDIVITRAFAAPVQTIFESWTTPESIREWWDPSGSPLAICEMDVRVGGRFRFVHASGNGAGHVFAGTYREVDPPRRLVFATPAPSGGETVGTLEFSEHGTGTLLTMTMTSASREAREMLIQYRVDSGTVTTIENLERYLQRRG
jgi:uncharacterized protein YndB with AHSA1/START domain